MTEDKFIIYQYQTIDLPLELDVEGVLEDYKHVFVSIKQDEIFHEQNERTLGIDVANDTINLHLDQDVTGMFRVGKAKLQVNIYRNNTERPVSDEVEIEFGYNQHPRVIV